MLRGRTLQTAIPSAIFLAIVFAPPPASAGGYVLRWDDLQYIGFSRSGEVRRYGFQGGWTIEVDDTTTLVPFGPQVAVVDIPQSGPSYEGWMTIEGSWDPHTFEAEEDGVVQGDVEAQFSFTFKCDQDPFLDAGGLPDCTRIGGSVNHVSPPEMPVDWELMYDRVGGPRGTHRAPASVLIDADGLVREDARPGTPTFEAGEAGAVPGARELQGAPPKLDPARGARPPSGLDRPGGSVQPGAGTSPPRGLRGDRGRLEPSAGTQTVPGPVDDADEDGSTDRIRPDAATHGIPR